MSGEKRPRLMIVDDSLFMRHMLRDIAEQNGFEVAGEAASLRQVVEVYEKCRPDVVTMDITLDRQETMGGLEALKALRAADPQARIVVISALEQAAVKEAFRAAGAAAFVAKPFAEPQVIAALQEALRGGWEFAT